nr:immunoglobulin light chain junction region [Macaca mulatta]MOW09526.1 immunoglobulin light chain junction region [Macaca mulatta]MOW12355.1 immunoglobulin light chain junction region [Macaca mulatta]
CLQYNISPFTF